MSAKILVVDDEKSSVEATVEVLEREGYDLYAAAGGREALKTLDEERIDVVITDLKMPDLSGIELLTHIRDRAPDTQVIILTGYGTVDSAVKAMHAGAISYLQKPVNIDILRQTVRNALEKWALFIQNVNLREQLDDKFGFDNIIGRSKPMIELFRLTRQVAPTNATVLITGENGVGKELIAKAIHNHSRRTDKPYKVINCAALTPTLLESELFGHERGAFTGATSRKLGIFEQSHNGTLVLDEIGEMGLEAQVRFLRVLEQGEFTRVGGDKTITVDVRIIAATNRDLEEAVTNKDFRPDLYHRINRFRLRVPPLRERREDIPLLVDVFIKELSREHVKPISEITVKAMDYLKKQDWSGNIRELRNTIETAVILTTTESISIEDFFTDTQKVPQQTEGPAGDSVGTIGMTMEEIEKEAIHKTLEQTSGNKKQAAEILGIGLRTLYRKLESYGWINAEREL
ncbi:TPA: sigma-54-dependent Fis family transcriptional regulator [Candidatus Poribacteria bacterium]|nr:sigma-54-dependent Fis family transcriptional regulator [Candidatus Poribacteria bacterium]HIN30025.1 sigma-54-dependent Fis family transcriptional regulator [Candidatus Poribacteria bacterium]